MATSTTIVLVGGTGSRMRPLSSEIPKAMISLAGRPLLDHLLEALRRQGFTDVVLTSAGRHGEVRERYGDGRSRHMRIRYAEPARWRGTAACAADALAKLGSDVRYPVLVVYGDSLLEVDFRRMVRQHQSRQAAATILCHTPRFDAFLYDYHDGSAALPRLGRRTNYGIVDVDGDGYVVKIEEKPLLRRLHRFKQPAANAAAYVLNAAAWKHVPRTGWCDFPQDLFPRLLAHGMACFGFDIGDGYRLDLGTLRNYYATQMALLRGRIAVGIDLPRRAPGLWVSSSATLAHGSTLRGPAILGHGTAVAAGARVAHSVLGAGVIVGAHARITASVVLDGAVIEAGAILSRCIVGPGVRIGAGVRLPPGTCVGLPCHIVTFDPGMQAREFESLLRCRSQRPARSRGRRQ